MTLTLKELQGKVRSQKELIPAIYGNIDFNITPERFTDDPNTESMLSGRLGKKYRNKLLSKTESVERARAYTMLGDTVADAYAALIGKQYSFRQLVDMLDQACENGVESVANAPEELSRFIACMEKIPDWLDMDLVDQGARHSRIHMATMVPFALRGTFIATFMNKYSGLPMAMTGALSGNSAARRVNETGSFFTSATLPGALRRNGKAFQAAAKVRLMHSMVRYDFLTKPGKWDCETYGIPIPQVDQMPAGTIPAFLTAFKVIQQGRKRFTRAERGLVELCRYQSYLLGLPEELLPDTPREIFNIMLTYSSTLREGFDDAVGGELVRATMAGYRPRDKSFKSKIYNEIEKSFSRVFFHQVFTSMTGKPYAKIMGVEADLKDYALFAANCYILPQMGFHFVAEKIPVLNEIADRSLISKIHALLTEYGHAEFITDVAEYSYAAQQDVKLKTGKVLPWKGAFRGGKPAAAGV
ncbi:MAG: DUF2236 domain-containing protein [Pseudomonadales bacterium]|nr:DUF2236 domain-containing protein [Pseudomonadales bacterium]